MTCILVEDSRMPSELRILRFRLDEAEAAIRMLAPRIGMVIPDGAFNSANNDPSVETPSTVFCQNNGENQIRVTNGKLAASLIYLCRQNGVELPDEGTKEIYVSSGFVELRMVLRHQAEQGMAARISA